MKILSDLTWSHITIGCLVIVILLLLYTNYRCATKSCVVNLQKEGFNKCPQSGEQKPESGSGKNEIVLYYVSWCPHCKTLMPEWDKFETHAKNNLSWLKVSKIQCEDSNAAMCSQKGVEGFPTIIFYDQNGKTNIYDGDRKMEAIADFANKRKQ